MGNWARVWERDYAHEPYKMDQISRAVMNSRYQDGLEMTLPKCHFSWVSTVLVSIHELLATNMEMLLYIILISRPSHHSVCDRLQFWKKERKKKTREKEWVHLITWICQFPLVDRGGEWSPTERTSWKPLLVASCLSAGVPNICKQKTYHTFFRTKNVCTKCVHLVSDPTPLCLPNRHSCHLHA